MASSKTLSVKGRKPKPKPTKAIQVGDIVRVDGEDFDSVVMQIESSGDFAKLAGWPNPSFPITEMKLVKRYDEATANGMQQAVIKREQARLAQVAKEIESRCPHCNGSGRKRVEAVVG